MLFANKSIRVSGGVGLLVFSVTPQPSSEKCFTDARFQQLLTGFIAMARGLPLVFFLGFKSSTISLTFHALAVRTRFSQAVLAGGNQYRSNCLLISQPPEVQKLALVSTRCTSHSDFPRLLKNCVFPPRKNYLYLS